VVDYRRTELQKQDDWDGDLIEFVKAAASPHAFTLFCSGASFGCKATYSNCSIGGLEALPANVRFPTQTCRGGLLPIPDI